MTNILLDENREIDLLAVNLKTGDKYHVESKCGTNRRSWLRSQDLDDFHRKKFNHPIVMKKIRGLFGDSDYQKWIVVWNVQNEHVVTDAVAKYDIKIYCIHELIDVLRNRRLTSGSRDIVMRMIEFSGIPIPRVKYSLKPTLKKSSQLTKNREDSKEVSDWKMLKERRQE